MKHRLPNSRIRVISSILKTIFMIKPHIERSSLIVGTIKSILILIRVNNKSSTSKVNGATNSQKTLNNHNMDQKYSTKRKTIARNILNKSSNTMRTTKIKKTHKVINNHYNLNNIIRRKTIMAIVIIQNKMISFMIIARNSNKISHIDKYLIRKGSKRIKALTSNKTHKITLTKKKVVRNNNNNRIVRRITALSIKRKDLLVQSLAIGKIKDQISNIK